MLVSCSLGGGTGGGFDFHSPMDIFDMFFGGGGRGRSRGPQKGKDVIHQLKVSLEDLYNGTTRKLSLKKKVICGKCDGMYGDGRIFSLSVSKKMLTYCDR